MVDRIVPRSPAATTPAEQKSASAPKPAVRSSSADQFETAAGRRAPVQLASVALPPRPEFLGGKNDREKFADSTKDLRDTASRGRAIQAELSKTPPSDPKHAQLKQQLAAVDQQLSQKYGYSTASAPRPGTLWVDPQFLGGQLS